MDGHDPKCVTFRALPVTSDGVYWFKDEEPYCMANNRQKAVIWMILHTIMGAEYPIKYKGIQLNENE